MKENQDPLADIVDSGTTVAYYQHAYFTRGFDVKAKRTHACLKTGHWCWSNALTNPRMAIRFIIWKLKQKMCTDG